MKKETRLKEIARIEVWEKIYNWSCSDFCGEPEKVIESFSQTVRGFITENIKKYNSFKIDYERGGPSYYDSVDPDQITLLGCRLESDKEYKERARDIKQNENWRREQYEQLKKEFERK